MDNTGYITLSRQSGLMKQMETIANNIANASTEGYRREGVIFAEMINQLAAEGGSISQSDARIRRTDFTQAALRDTGGTFDFGIEGDGFFQIETPAGPALTRAGNFGLNTEAELVTQSGSRVLDTGGGPVLLPPEATQISVSTDGTVSADGEPIGQIAMVTIADLSNLTRLPNGLFETTQALIPAENATVFQGFVEESNVNPVIEVTRMIQVQRAYEMGQSFLEAEDERMRQFIRVLGTTT